MDIPAMESPPQKKRRPKKTTISELDQSIQTGFELLQDRRERLTDAVDMFHIRQSHPLCLDDLHQQAEILSGKEIQILHAAPERYFHLTWQDSVSVLLRQFLLCHGCLVRAANPTLARAEGCGCIVLCEESEMVDFAGELRRKKIPYIGWSTRHTGPHTVYVDRTAALHAFFLDQITQGTHHVILAAEPGEGDEFLNLHQEYFDRTLHNYNYSIKLHLEVTTPEEIQNPRFLRKILRCDGNGKQHLALSVSSRRLTRGVFAALSAPGWSKSERSQKFHLTTWNVTNEVPYLDTARVEINAEEFAASLMQQLLRQIQCPDQDDPGTIFMPVYRPMGHCPVRHQAHTKTD